MATVEQVPPWVLRSLPVNAIPDESLHRRIDELAGNLPENLWHLTTALRQVQEYREYDAAANHAAAYVWLARQELLAGETRTRSFLLTFAQNHMSEPALAYFVRRLVKDPDANVRQKARRLVEKMGFREVALPATPEGAWDASGWLRGTRVGPLSRHRQGRRILEKHDLPVLSTLAQLRKVLEISSARQLGYFLLASDAQGGPYTRFTLPKRTGGERVICAPKKQLRWVQRQILDKILAEVPVHAGAHGFVAGRSTGTISPRPASEPGHRRVRPTGASHRGLVVVPSCRVA